MKPSVLANAAVHYQTDVVNTMTVENPMTQKRLTAKGRSGLAACVASAAIFGGIVSAAHAAPPTCDADKLQAVGAYANCRLDADASALQKGTTTDYTQCDTRLARDLARAVEKSSGACSLDSDLQSVQLLVKGYTDSMAAAVSVTDDGCPPEYATRSRDQVVADLWDAVSRDDPAAIACSFHENAYMFDDQGLLVGRDDITAYLRSLNALFGFVAPTIIQDDGYRNTVRRLFSIDGGWVVLPDGVDTYMIEAGKIRWGSRHGLIEFTGPPLPPGWTR